MGEVIYQVRYLGSTWPWAVYRVASGLDAEGRLKLSFLRCTRTIQEAIALLPEECRG